MTDLTSSIAERYRQAYQSFVELVRSLSDDELAASVPTCPKWTVRDVVSHVAGIADDAFNGRMDGATTDPWTAAQVERYAKLPLESLLGQWALQADAFADVLQAMGEYRPPIDCHSHEHDIRLAVGKPGNRDNAIVELAAAGLVSTFVHPRALQVELADGRQLHGGGDGPPITLRGVAPFEVFRSRLGRRSQAQVVAYDWSDDPTELLGAWFSLGPAAGNIDEG